MTRARLGFALAFLLGSGVGCVLGEGGADEGPVCPEGKNLCPCNPNGTCEEGLECVGGTCEFPEGATTTESGEGESDDTGTETGDGEACEQGTLDCPCYGNDTCNEGLECQSGTCAEIECPEGSEGCPCFGNMTCDTEALECQGGTCVMPRCPEGSEGCACYGNDTCDDGLMCEGGVCTTTCPEGSEGCPCFGNLTCATEELVCVMDECVLLCSEDAIGTPGCPCYDNDTCNEGFACESGTCGDPECPTGSFGCPCGPMQMCDEGLSCDAGVCELG